MANNIEGNQVTVSTDGVVLLDQLQLFPISVVRLHECFIYVVYLFPAGEKTIFPCHRSSSLHFLSTERNRGRRIATKTFWQITQDVLVIYVHTLGNWIFCCVSIITYSNINSR